MNNAGFFFFKEGNLWIVAWSKHTLMTQGTTKQIAFDRMLSLIGETVVLEAVDGNSPLSSVGVPNAQTIKKWKELHERDKNAF